MNSKRPEKIKAKRKPPSLFCKNLPDKGKYCCPGRLIMAMLCLDTENQMCAFPSTYWQVYIIVWSMYIFWKSWIWYIDSIRKLYYLHERVPGFVVTMEQFYFCFRIWMDMCHSYTVICAILTLLSSTGYVHLRLDIQIHYITMTKWQRVIYQWFYSK